MALKGDHPDFAYRITWEGGYVLSITNSKGIVDYSGADPVVDLARCPPWLPNLAFSKIYVTLNRGICSTQPCCFTVEKGEISTFALLNLCNIKQTSLLNKGSESALACMTVRG